MHDDVQWAVSESEAQVLSEHRWKPVSHAGTHDVPSQVTEPLVGGAVHFVHVGPQPSVVLFATQVGACAVPSKQNPGRLQTTRQLNTLGFWPPLSHTAMPLPAGAGHAAHDVPQLLVERSETQGPVPAGQR